MSKQARSLKLNLVIPDTKNLYGRDRNEFVIKSSGKCMWSGITKSGIARFDCIAFIAIIDRLICLYDFCGMDRRRITSSFKYCQLLIPTFYKSPLFHITLTKRVLSDVAHTLGQTRRDSDFTNMNKSLRGWPRYNRGSI